MRLLNNLVLSLSKTMLYLNNALGFTRWILRYSHSVSPAIGPCRLTRVGSSEKLDLINVAYIALITMAVMHICFYIHYIV